jgi:adenylate cyclase
VLAIGLALSICVLGLREAGLLQPIELIAHDRLLMASNGFAGALQPSPVLLIRIQEKDIVELGHPLSDATLARVLEILSSFEPRAIGVDIFRPQAVGKGREALEAVVTGNSRIVMAHRLEDRHSEGVPPPFGLIETVHCGFSDLVPDPGGIIRRGLLILWDDTGKSFLSFPLQLALAYLRDEGITLTDDPSNPEFVRLGDTTIRAFRHRDGGYVRADAGGYQYLLDYRRGRAPFPSFTVGEVLEGEVDPAAVRQRIVIIGTTSPSVQDQHDTPYNTGSGGEPAMYGIEIHAHSVDQLLRIALAGDEPVVSWPEWTENIWILGWGLLGGFLATLIRSALGGTITGLASLGSLTFVATALFFRGVWIPVVPPTLAWVTSAALGLAYVFQREHAERAHLRRLFDMFVSSKLVDSIWDQRAEFMDGRTPRPQWAVLTVMMTDLQGYTSATERMDPATHLEWVNEYLVAMSRLVEAHGGIVDDYAGDGIKANFGVPIARTEDEQIKTDAVNAVSCALAMGRELERLNQRWRDRELPSARMRIGIHTGMAATGSIGSEHRLKYTSVGDTVNVASRLESFDKAGFESEPDPRGFRILVGEPTWRRLGDRFCTAYIGASGLKGRSEEIEIYEVLGDEQGEPAAGSGEGEKE